MPTTYQGDIDLTTEEVVPFSVAALDGVDMREVATMERVGGVEVTGNPIEAQGLLIRGATKFLTDGDFEKYTKLMYLIRVGVGTDNVDLHLASQKGIATLNTPGVSTDAVARRALSFMLAWAAKIIPSTESLRNGVWRKGYEDTDPEDLGEKTLGIVGYGAIGQRTAEIAGPFFRRVLLADVREIPGKVPLEVLLRESDVVSIHVSGKDEVLTAEHIALMRNDALLVNTARGEVVNTEVLLDKMYEGLSIALDVYPREGEGMFKDSILMRIVEHPRFFGTPHTAASDPVTQRKLAQEGVERMAQFATQGVVNPKDLQGHTLPKVDPGLKRYPGVRGILTHPSVPGVLATITRHIASFGLNIRGLVNEESSLRGAKDKLAMTIFDLVDVQPKSGVEVMRAIQGSMETYKARILYFV